MQLSQVYFCTVFGCSIQLLVTVSVCQPHHLKQNKICINISQLLYGESLKEICCFPDKNTVFCPAQILLSGVTVDRYNNVLLQDEELASMRQGRDFLSQINDGVPKTLTSMKLLARTLEEGQKAPLTQGQFETVVLSVAFSAHQAYSQKSTEEREAWGEVLLQLANITVHHLRGKLGQTPPSYHPSVDSLQPLPSPT
uniref:Family with sequence similarity 180 member A n=1 Tax=Oryzias latipes TaxID=8090 RepID=A0A3P9LZZ3_ORYLA